MPSIKTGLTYQNALLGQRERGERKEAFKMAETGISGISYAEAANFGRTATLLKKYSAAIKLQSLARVVIAKTCVDSLKKKDAATIIQALYRGSNQMSEYKSDLRPKKIIIYS